MVEIFASGKGCSILRPVRFPYEFEEEIYNGATVITQKEKFLQSLREEQYYPIPKENLDERYLIDPEQPTYLKICDFLEKIYKEVLCKIDFPHNDKFQNPFYRIPRNIKYSIILTMIQNEKLHKLGRIVWGKEFPIHQFEYQIWQNNYHTQQDVDQIMKRLHKALDQ